MVRSHGNLNLVECVTGIVVFFNRFEALSAEIVIGAGSAFIPVSSQAALTAVADDAGVRDRG